MNFNYNARLNTLNMANILYNHYDILTNLNTTASYAKANHNVIDNKENNLLMKQSNLKLNNNAHNINVDLTIKNKSLLLLLQIPINNNLKYMQLVRITLFPTFVNATRIKSNTKTRLMANYMDLYNLWCPNKSSSRQVWWVDS